jgi:membrane-bound serine protease (ClpP class)
LAGYIVLGVIVAAVITYFVVVWVIKAHRKQVSTGREDLVGKTAVVEVALEPRGVVFVEGERWTAVIDNGHAEPEEEVIINKVVGLKLLVTRKLKEA